MWSDQSWFFFTASPRVFYSSLTRKILPVSVISSFWCLSLLFQNGEAKENLRKTSPRAWARHSGFIASNHFWQLQFQQAPYNHKVAHTLSTSAFSSWWTQTPRSCPSSHLSVDFLQSSQMKRARLMSAALNPVWHAGRAIKTCPWMKMPASWDEWPPQGWSVIRCCHIGSSPGTLGSAGGPGLPAVSGSSYKGFGQYSLWWLMGFWR